jgi:CheY-like chemotaxis protein
LRDDAGRVVGVVAIGYDVTQEVLLRQAAQDANRAKDEFLAMLGHELRNPLSPIVTALQLLRLRDGERRELSIIDRQVGHLVRLVDDLLDISRITRGKVELRKRRLELVDPVLRGLEMAGPLIEQRRQRIDCRVEPEGLPVLGDPDRLAQIVSNLVTNACKYSEPGSRVTLIGERRAGRVALRVVDEGIGLPVEMLDRVFDLFVQQPQAIDRSKGGLGLGLAIVRSLVALHGGRVEAKSPGPGLGSEFIVELPVAPEAQNPEGGGDDDDDPGAAVRPRRRPPVSRGATRILVIDDNQDAAESIAELLGELGHEVAVAHDGPSALQRARQMKPNVCLVDIGLPVMDGYELAQRLRASGDLAPGARLIALTGYGRDADQRRSQEAGFDKHVVKPVRLDTLSKVLGN